MMLVNDAALPNDALPSNNWSNRIIRVDECVTLGMNKFSSPPLQYEPKLFIFIELTPLNLVNLLNTLIDTSTLKWTKKSIRRN